MTNRSTGRLGRLLNVVIPGVAACNARGFQPLKNTTRFPNPAGRNPFGNDARRGYLRGFTLIELLVVVLIIGILSAIALPQYEKAVNRARYTQAQTLLTSLYEAEQVYYMANGSYTTHFSDLDMEVPDKQKIRERVDGDMYEDDWGYCHLHNTGYGQCNVKVGNGNVWYMRYWRPGVRPPACWVTPRDNQKGRDLCRAMTGSEETTEGATSAEYAIYYF